MIGKHNSAGLHRLLLQSLARIRGRLRDLLRPQPRLAIKFPTDQELFISLSDAAVVGAGLRPALRLHLVRHFRTRNAPRFFVDPGTMADALATIVAQHPGWREQALSDARDWCENLGGAYLTSLGVKGAIDWQHLPMGPGHDHLYQDRIHLFAFAVILARALSLGAPVREDLRRNITTWMRLTESHPDPTGYSSGLIVVYRAVALTWTLAFLAGCPDEDAELEFMLLRIMLTDARFIAARLGTSFANNHLLADGFCLWYLGTLFPEFAEAVTWKTRGEAVWLRELRRQILDDGTSFEQSSHYQLLACEMALGYVLISRRNDSPVPEWVSARVEKMLAFHADLCGSAAPPMAFGDGVEDPLYPLMHLRNWGHGDYRAIYQSLFRRDAQTGDLSASCNEPAFWLLGGTLPARESIAQYNAHAAYAQGGCHVFRGNDAGSRLLLRTGPASDVLVNPGHMHADQLSIALNLRDQPVIVDAGTYTYRSDPRHWPERTPDWRQYFMSPFAHNGLAIDGEDPLRRGPGDFPGKPIQSRVRTDCATAGMSLAHVAAEMVGDTLYCGHRRGVIAVCDRYWLVYDALPTGVPLERLSFGLQLAIGARVTRESKAQALRVDAGRACLDIAVSDGLVLDRIMSGETDPVGGWVSPRYGERREAPMLRYRTTGAPGPHATLLSPSAKDRPLPKIEVFPFPAGACAFRISDDRCVDYLMVSSKDDETGLSALGVEFAGKLLWLRTVGGVLEELRWLEGRRVVWQEQGLQVNTRGIVEELRIVASSTGTQIMGCPPDQVFVVWGKDAAR